MHTSRANENRSGSDINDNILREQPNLSTPLLAESPSRELEMEFGTFMPKSSKTIQKVPRSRSPQITAPQSSGSAASRRSDVEAQYVPAMSRKRIVAEAALGTASALVAGSATLGVVWPPYDDPVGKAMVGSLAVGHTAYAGAKFRNVRRGVMEKAYGIRGSQASASESSRATNSEQVQAIAPNGG
jgi:hypothetical protein